MMGCFKGLGDRGLGYVGVESRGESLRLRRSYDGHLGLGLRSFLKFSGLRVEG